jgi:GrpB-like predicted nucleotidyltransferase (UPF0157 family)
MTKTTNGGDRAALRDEEIRAIWVDEPPPHDATIEIVLYDPAWPGLYEREATRVRAALGDRVVRLEHTGSTSVPGLSAKPRIDMLLVVPDSSDEVAYVAPLEAAGYRLVIREPEWHEHRVFKGPDTDINLHVFSPDSPEIDRLLRFRDWLRTHDDDRELYQQTKLELGARTWKYIQNYADAKSEVVEAIIARAEAAEAAEAIIARAEAAEAAEAADVAGGSESASESAPESAPEFATQPAEPR